MVYEKVLKLIEKGTIIANISIFGFKISMKDIITYAKLLVPSEFPRDFVFSYQVPWTIFQLIVSGIIFSLWYRSPILIAGILCLLNLISFIAHIYIIARAFHLFLRIIPSLICDILSLFASIILLLLFCNICKGGILVIVLKCYLIIGTIYVLWLIIANFIEFIGFLWTLCKSPENKYTANHSKLPNTSP